MRIDLARTVKACTFAPAFGKEAALIERLGLGSVAFTADDLKKKVAVKFGRYGIKFLPLQPLSR